MLNENKLPPALLLSFIFSVLTKRNKFSPRYSPIGICSMIAAKLAAMDDILVALKLVGMFMVTVIVGLLIHVLIVLPIIYLAITRKNPYRFMKGLREAMVTAFGTDSRWVKKKKINR